MSSPAPGTARSSAGGPVITGPAAVMLKASAVLAVLVALAVGVFALFQSRRHAQERFNDIQVTLAPGVSLQSLPWNDNLPRSGAEQFAILPSGNLVVRAGGRLYDFSDGSPLVSGTDIVQSFALVKGALAVITSNGRLGYVGDQSISDVGAAPQDTTAIASTSGGDELFLLNGNALSSLSDDGMVHALVASPEAISAVGGDRERHVFSVGNSLFLQSGAGRPVMLIDFPDQRILGVALDGDRIYCSTPRGIYQVRGALMVPLALGVAGELLPASDGLFVLNAENSRLYRLVFEKPGQ